MAQQHAHDAGTPGRTAGFEVLTAEEAREVEALTTQIIPSGGAPGAREAGVVYFIDRALATFDADKKESYRRGLARVRQARVKLFPESTASAALSSEQLIERSMAATS